MIDEINQLKGFMPINEGTALLKWAKKFSKSGPVMEIGTYCGKSTIYLAIGALHNNQTVYTIDHHKGSEEHQIDEEYFDSEIYDFIQERVNTFPLLIKNINKLCIKNIIPIISESSRVSKNWETDLSMLFIDGGHSLESANNDYDCWEPRIIKGGALVIHDIFENPEDGGQAPFEIYKRSIEDNYKLFERVDTTVCLIKV